MLTSVKVSTQLGWRDSDGPLWGGELVSPPGGEYVTQENREWSHDFRWTEADVGRNAEREAWVRWVGFSVGCY